MHIKRCFDDLAAQGRKGLVAYVTAGDPFGKTVEVMHELVKGGADLIELGFPFSDPVADGPVIAAAHERALSQGVTLHDVFAIVSAFRTVDNNTPVVLMGYLNPIEVMGYEVFARKAAQAGVNGVLVVDLPAEFACELVAELKPRQIDMIYLVTPTTTDDRIRDICSVASGFVYYVSIKGITGANTLNLKDIRRRVSYIKTFTDLPVNVGFGIRDGDSAAAISSVADGVIVGSVLVNELAKYPDEGDACIEAVSGHLRGMRAAMDQMARD